jgi:hypothetical protein
MSPRYVRAVRRLRGRSATLSIEANTGEGLSGRNAGGGHSSLKSSPARPHTHPDVVPTFGVHLSNLRYLDP